MVYKNKTIYEQALDGEFDLIDVLNEFPETEALDIYNRLCRIYDHMGQELTEEILRRELKEALK